VMNDEEHASLRQSLVIPPIRHSAFRVHHFFKGGLS
jgi:hypothetical protein